MIEPYPVIVPRGVCWRALSPKRLLHSEWILADDQLLKRVDAGWESRCHRALPDGYFRLWVVGVTQATWYGCVYSLATTWENRHALPASTLDHEPT